MDDTQAKIQQTFDAIADGRSVREACRITGLERSRFWRLIRNDTELMSQYDRARSCSADVQFDDMQELESSVESGAIDPNTFRVMLDSRKWRFARMNKRYNERQQVDLVAKVDTTSTHQLSDDAAALLDKLIK